ncbi:hypothetical protein BVX97_01535 [bacterium E08(2017)]|nr:hypothetical protein BVX97_01535 [bacterium E08(2017)]
MKALFLMACIFAAVSFSLLGIVYGTGTIPFVEPVEPEEPVVTEKVQEETEQLQFSPDELVIRDLKKELETRVNLYDAKLKEISEREQKLDERQAIVEQLKMELEDLYKDINEKVVIISESEKANFKRLADIYSKMESDSAASLMISMKPERAAIVLSMITDRQAAAIVASAIAQGDSGTRTAVEWADIMRRINKNTETGS